MKRGSWRQNFVIFEIGLRLHSRADIGCMVVDKSSSRVLLTDAAV